MSDALDYSQSRIEAVGEDGYAFGRFVLYPLRRVLLDGSRERNIGGRAAAILSALLARAGEIVTKEELLAAGWPSTFVVEENLRVQIGTLRKILGDNPDQPRYITSILGRGYCFVQAVEIVPSEGARSHSGAKSERASLAGMPKPIDNLVGRDEALDGIVELVEKKRLVTIVGPGGIGKTAAALAACERVTARFDEQSVFVDLSTVASEELVPLAVATAFKISAQVDDPLASLASYLKHRRAFILLDNCEHVVGIAARLVESLLRAVPGLRILATSREPLRCEGEWLYRLAPLALPLVDDLLLTQARLYPSVELFIERATSDDRELLFDDSDVPFIIEICQKLDGIPLAIEIAAARVEAFGIAELTDRLCDCLDVPGRRTSVDRHQTMRKMLDWSFENLTDAERVLLRRLSVFAGAFSLEAATMVVGDEKLSSFAISEGVASLVRKSLIHPNPSSSSINYRLLESTRLYALERLADAMEVERMRSLHIQFTIDLMARADADWTVTRRAIWIDRYSCLLGDIRQALKWAFAPGGDASAGVKLGALSIPLGLHMGLVDEFRQVNDIAIAAARGLKGADIAAEIRLNTLHGFLNTNQKGPQSDTFVGLNRAVELADSTDDGRHKILPRIVAGGFNMGMGSYGEGLRFAEEVGALATSLGNELAILGSQRILAQTSHFSGDHARSSALARTVLASPTVNIPFAFGGVQVDKRVSMRIVLSRSLWLQGKPDQAALVMQDALDIAPEDGAVAVCQSLAQAVCPILIWRGEEEDARHHVKRLLSESARFTLRHWNSWGTMYSKVLGSEDSGGHGTSPQIAADGVLQLHTLATITGQLDGIDFGDPEILGTTGWAGPEILRRRGIELLRTDEQAAERLFLRSRKVARAQGAVAWELRAATNLAEIWLAKNDTARGLASLLPIYEQFTEGFETADLRAAARLLSRLQV
ncbi:hypothetical protein HA462_02850 [Rhizobium leguminosarum bv. trifolii]|nr:hypothetical protein HA462_02850 [Rhizobium leguminosarum bv. trifolii]